MLLRVWLITVWILPIFRNCECKHRNKDAFFSQAEPEQMSFESVLLSAHKMPSELACSQKCLYNKKCNYQAYNYATQKCQLLNRVSQQDFSATGILKKKEKLCKKETSLCNTASSRFCIENCKCVYTSTRQQAYECCSVYESCEEALKDNNYNADVYRIQPPKLNCAVEVECKKGLNGEPFAVLHHNNENETLVDGFEAAGSYKFNFYYTLGINVILSLIQLSNQCQQYTKVRCFGSILSDSWLIGPQGQKLAFWGGGPSDGQGCACGITNTCASTTGICNCNKNDHTWRVDDGNVVKKDALPITVIAVGDTGSEYEQLMYTVGPLLCIL